MSRYAENFERRLAAVFCTNSILADHSGLLKIRPAAIGRLTRRQT
jgi:hypothetical protein